MSLTDFTRSYVRTALWASTGPDDQPLDATHSPLDFDPESIKRLHADAMDFYGAHVALFGEQNARRAGHDLWLTRNGHGCGFWDGDWPFPASNVLTQAARDMGECALYVGDDGLIHAM